MSQVFCWHALLSSCLMMIFLRLDCHVDPNSDKLNLGQVTDWDINDTLQLMETILEECPDDLDGTESKTRFVKFS